MEQVVRARQDRGFTLVEIMIALAVVSIALLGLLSLINSSGLVQDDTRARTIAYNAAREKVEEMRARPFDTIYAAYNSDDYDDQKIKDLVTAALPTVITVTIPKNKFFVDGLPSLIVGGVAVEQGSIIFPEAIDPSDGNPYLTEIPTDVILQKEFGMEGGKDLNRDGVVDKLITTYTLLPVKIEVSWTAVGGKTITLPIVTYMTNR
ncbi:MAG TPA: prepilin-type N-terminal cleavage/methylation domain-containing protein [Planctomycetota bacterium]